MSGSTNRVVLVGNLTRDPELRATPGGTPVCSLRIAVNENVKDQQSGEWRDRANYFNVSIFGSRGEALAGWLTKGRQVAIDGRLRWSEWDAQDGSKRERVDVIADNVQALGPRQDGAGGSGHYSDQGRAAPRPEATREDVKRALDAEDDDIPF